MVVDLERLEPIAAKRQNLISLVEPFPLVCSNQGRNDKIVAWHSYLGFSCFHFFPLVT